MVYRNKVNSIAISKDGYFIAVAFENSVKIYHAPTIEKSIEPLVLLKKYTSVHPETINAIDFSNDGRFIITSSKDLTCKILNVHSIENYVPFIFTGHKSKVIKGFFSSDMRFFYTLTRDGYLFLWKWVEDFLSDEYKKFKNYQKNKIGRKIKLDSN